MSARNVILSAGLAAVLAAVAVGIVAASRSSSAPASSTSTAPAADVGAASAASPGAPPSPSLSGREHSEWTSRTLAEALTSEARDETWASATELSLQALVGEAGVPGIRAIDARCHQTMCRLAVTFDGSPSLRALKHLLLRPELSTSGYHALGPEDQVIIYLARAGTDLRRHPHFTAAFSRLAAR